MIRPEQIAARLVQVQVGHNGRWGVRIGRLYDEMAVENNSEEMTERWAAQVREDLIGGIRPLYDQACEAMHLLAVVCHDDERGLIELGRREERGRILAIVRRVLAAISECTSEAARGRRMELEALERDLVGAGPACAPLPPAEATERIAVLEKALVEIEKYLGGDGPVYASARMELARAIARAALALPMPMGGQP